MMRVLPMRSARSIWPRALLILCAPVWARSSRLNHTSAPPHFSGRRSAKTGGAARPTTSRRGPRGGPAPGVGEAVGEQGGGRAAHKVAGEAVELLVELGVVAVAFVGLFELFEGVDQSFGDEPAAEGPEVPLAGLNLLPQR